VGMISLSFGIGGADFQEIPRPRMFKPLWMFASMVAALVISMIIVLPVIAYEALNVFSAVLPEGLPAPPPHYYLYLAWAVSGLLALTTVSIGYLISMRMADKLFSGMDQ
ncbi:MAG TPA: hypothetical protein VK436_07060, partial [Methanocella sp.]|nr:hypothetical protein [Methanocella sp.]